jgi:hypothetical protein
MIQYAPYITISQMALSLQEHAATNVNEKTPRTRIDYDYNITI